MTVGGTGKTPLVISIARWLQSRGHRVGVLSRGYQREKRTSFLLVSDGKQVLATPLQGGDEPYLMAQRLPGVAIAVGTDRYELGRWVLNQIPIDCFVLDDGFQHLGLARDINLLVVDSMDVDGLKGILPAGRLREPLEAARRATAIIFTRVEPTSPTSNVHQVLKRAMGRDFVPILTKFVFSSLIGPGLYERRELDVLKGAKVMMVSGVGNPDSFRKMVATLGAKVMGERIFVDHYRYTEKDLISLREQGQSYGAQAILTTEKDLVKMEPFLQSDDDVWALRLELEFIQGQERLADLLLEDDAAHVG